MKTFREDKEINIELKEMQEGDRIVCDDYEELVKICRDLAYMGYKYRQIEPMVIVL